MQQRREQYKLDVGCNGGFFLNSFSDGFDKNGIEIDKSSVNFANENFDNLSEKIHCVNLQDYYSTTKSGRFDLITMRGVIEHVTDPVKSIEIVSNLLNTGGCLQSQQPLTQMQYL
jgi:2-polyprenyl-3-methyl-5-hydroxy-6-metoxy-1,4-benzoquinol methylase